MRLGDRVSLAVMATVLQSLAQLEGRAQVSVAAVEARLEGVTAMPEQAPGFLIVFGEQASLSWWVCG